MAKVVLPLEVARTFAAGETEHEFAARDVRELMRQLEQRIPGIRARLERGIAVAIDTEIYQDWFVEPIGPDSEVRFLPAIEGG
ncbi:MAG: MoaD/ThiS family protein [Gammaproteobacteria bacterium]|nr:MoaD/ThiS family protein [Gammaproteobacteria bacterium]